MSAINKALSELSEKSSSIELEKAEIPSITKSKPWLWLMGGFLLSLALGGWAVSQGSHGFKQDMTPIVNSDSFGAVEGKTAQPMQQSSPTSKVTPKFEEVVYVKTTEHLEADKTEQTELSEDTNQILGAINPPQTMRPSPPAVTMTLAVNEPSLIGRVQESSMHVEPVRLTHQQLARKARLRADKALEANELDAALMAFHEVLRHQPQDIQARQKLAALYFGKGETRKAYELLQAGISLDMDNQKLRLALAKMLMRTEQPEAALSPLLYLPAAANQEYLAMRAILAQKNKQTPVALESYHLLVQRQPANARWWLGLAIQQERENQFKEARSSYLSALRKVGISNQSQDFIRQRLHHLQQQEITQ
ncbi:hypothetical protein VAZ01S_026_00170 [Vibrio azureus NBRC 104587]|uniref:Uncharacterized protein n=1 Tax=Vibrio azureus NBRC 104587 TaxID=1219077 RepID=U3A674_9VIBR|nr:tetratricopeptide repeat protein [Vibrio azureus]GAD75511.1 hypothetical protein VAZ01S_026_00170 [Vibrio azureus NBRC 104587]